MSEPTTSARDDSRHNRLMAGLEIVESEVPPQPPPVDETIEQHALAPIHAVWDGTGTRPVPPVHTARARFVPDKPPRRLAWTLPGLLLLALAAVFFAWVSAPPLWLLAGHGMAGTVTVTACDASGCHGRFQSDDGRHETTVRLTGDAKAERVGQSSPARVTSARATTAYAGDGAGLWWRVGFGLGLLLACGFAVAAVSGAWRMHGRSRLIAVTTSLTVPWGLFAVVLVATW